MSARYWISICLGALGIFAVGMVVIGMGRRGTDWVDDVAHSATTISIPLVLVPFRLNGNDIGSIKRLNILRENPDQVSGAELLVKLREAAVAPGADCALAIDDLDRIGNGATFYCADDATRRTDSLVPFGKVEFEPEGVTRPLLLPRDVVAEIGNRNRHTRAHAPRARAAALAQETESTADSLSLSGSEAGFGLQVINSLERAGILFKADSYGVAMHLYSTPEGDELSLKADSNGFMLSAHDGAKARFQMKADSSGVILNITDADGKTSTTTAKGDAPN